VLGYEIIKKGVIRMIGLTLLGAIQTIIGIKLWIFHDDSLEDLLFVPVGYINFGIGIIVMICSSI
jgi:hypothetical protein